MFTSSVLWHWSMSTPITSADKHSLEFTMNKVLYKIFGAMSKDSYGEICKYFGIDKVEESIRHRQENFVKRYSGYSNSLCHSISARLWHVKLLILYYCLFILCVFLFNLRYFLCYHVMVNKVVYSTIAHPPKPFVVVPNQSSKLKCRWSYYSFTT